jgi:superoxide dismutase, Cu-Zn family
MRKLLAVMGLAMALVLSAAAAAGAVGEQAGGTLIDGSGRAIGSVLLQETAGAVTVRVALNGSDVVKPGLHGIHFHAVGKCDGPDFMSAGAHFNPTGKKHGLNNPQGPHAGDLPNLPIDASTATQGGYAWITTTTLVTLSPGPSSLFDADGTALVIHANPDDEMTDPAGNSGGRIACAVLQRAAAPGLPNTGAGGAAPRPAPWAQAALLGLATLALTGAAMAFRRRRA